MKTEVYEMNSSADRILFDNGDLICGVLCSLGNEGYNLPILGESDNFRTGYKKLKQFVKRALKRNELILADNRYI